MEDELQQFIDALAPTLQAAVLRALQDVRARADMNKLELAWANGDATEITNLLIGDPGNTTMWEPVRAAVLSAITEAAMDTVMLNMKGDGDLLQVIMGAGTDPMIVQSVSTDLISEIDASTRDALKTWIQQSLSEGSNPVNSIAQVIGRMNRDGSRSGGVLGLTQNQMTSVDNYRNALMGGPNTPVYQDALDRALRDQRFDAGVKSAIERGVKLPQSRIDEMVRRYESRMLAYRARTIAVTEAGQAMARGQKFAWDTTINQGNVDAGDLDKRWVTAGDNRVREFHAEQHNVVVPYNKPFMLKEGTPKKFTIIPVWGAPHDVNCRCVTSIRPRL